MVQLFLMVSLIIHKLLFSILRHITMSILYAAEITAVFTHHLVVSVVSIHWVAIFFQHFSVSNTRQHTVSALK